MYLWEYQSMMFFKTLFLEFSLDGQLGGEHSHQPIDCSSPFFFLGDISSPASSLFNLHLPPVGLFPFAVQFCSCIQFSVHFIFLAIYSYPFGAVFWLCCLSLSLSDSRVCNACWWGRMLGLKKLKNWIERRLRLSPNCLLMKVNSLWSISSKWLSEPLSWMRILIFVGVSKRPSFKRYVCSFFLVFEWCSEY